MSLLAQWKLDETSGTTVAATVGSNGTKVGGDIVGVGAGNGPGGSLDDAGFVYDGVDDWVDVGLIKSGADNFQVLTTSTFACWFKREIDTVNRAFIGMYEGFGATDSAWVLTNRDGSSGPGHLGWRVRKGSTAYRFDGNAGTNMGYADNAWHHIAVTLPSRKVFVDGVDITSSFTFSGSVDQALTNTDRTWYLGAQWSGGSTITSPFAGSLADFRFYDSDESANVASIIDDARPTCSVSISGTPNVGQLFTATPLTNDSTATFEYQWYRADNASGLNEAAISGATSSTYTAQAADEGKYLRCRGRSTNTGGAGLQSAYAYSAYSAQVTAGGGSHSLTANNLSTGTPSVGSPALTQAHSLVAVGVTAGAPALGAPALGQVHALAAAGIAAGAPVLGSPALSQAGELVADPLASGAPVLGTPALSQLHVLAATGLATGAPAAGAPALAQLHVLAAAGVTTGPPSTGTPALAGAGSLTALGIATGPPSLGAPQLTQRHALAAEGITAQPELGQPALAQLHALIAAAIASGAPVLGAPVLVPDVGAYVPSPLRTVLAPPKQRTVRAPAASRAARVPKG